MIDPDRAIPLGSVDLDIAGLGIVCYSPSLIPSIGEGEDYLSTQFWKASDVQRHLQNGTIVGFGTGSSGRFLLQISRGRPSTDRLASADYKLRLGLRSDGVVIFRDLYDLLEWSATVPGRQAVTLDPGIYRVTVISDMPQSGLLGDNQLIDIYFELVDEFPNLSHSGVPTLCT